MISAPNPKPRAAIRNRTPVIGAAVRDPRTDLTKSDIVFFLDGHRIFGSAYNQRTDRLSFTPRNSLSFGGHVVRIVATDDAGNGKVRNRTFRVVR